MDIAKQKKTFLFYLIYFTCINDVYKCLKFLSLYLMNPLTFDSVSDGATEAILYYFFKYYFWTDG